MPVTTLPVQNVLLAEADDGAARVLGALIASVWPKPGKGTRERADQLLRFGAENDSAISHVVYEDGLAVAHALTFRRTIGTVEGDRPVLALAMVAADPDRRGRGLGVAVAKAAFARVDSGEFSSSLFQTSFAVRPFYERLGCQLVENRIINSHDEQHPEASPFWDDIVMRYPAEAPWPTGEIDLRGRGY